jgi:saccharopine dehydrogenase (NAD+, L-lysine-forming)
VRQELDVTVLGAGGIIAPALVRDLAESDEVRSLLLLDLDGARAAGVASVHGAGKATARGVDGGGQELRCALAGRDVLVNAASYRVNLDAMRACLDADCHYIDLGGLYWMTGRQLELDEQFKDAGLIALLGMGASPGKTNVMAAQAVELLGEQPRSIDVVVASRDPAAATGGTFTAPYALRTLVDEVTMAPVAIRDGEPVELDPLTPGGTVRLPEPFGARDTIQTIHSEMRTFPYSFGCSEASFRLSLPRELLGRLRELAGRPDGEVQVAAAKTQRPSGRTQVVHRVDAAGASGRVSVTAVTEPMKRWGLGGGIVSTAAPAAAAVRLLARGRLECTGALPPERCVAADALFPELETRNTTFSVERTPEAVHA